MTKAIPSPSSAPNYSPPGSPAKSLTPKPSLASCAAALEQLFEEIDSHDGEISDAMLARFDDAKLAVAAKVDNWIYFLDSLKAMAGALKERKERAHKAQKTAEALQQRLREYLKCIIEANPGVPFKGDDGSLALQKNPESVRYSFELEDKTFYKTVHPAVADMEPSIRPYMKQATVMLLDAEKVKADLKAGMQLSFARLEKGSHVRIRQ